MGRPKGVKNKSKQYVTVMVSQITAAFKENFPIEIHVKYAPILKSVKNSMAEPTIFNEKVFSEKIRQKNEEKIEFTVSQL